MTAAIASPPLKRFLWKEYRMLRGLWLAVLVLGLLIDWLLGVLLAPTIDYPTVRLGVALAAATLYAAGAAAVLFSVEHEEQTYDFLRGLPATWGPLFVGKFVVATVSAIALAVALGLIALVAGGRLQYPVGNNTEQAFGVFGIAIFEAIAWGTLCSLIFKRPLAAALVTLIVGPLAVSAAVSMMSTSTVPLNDAASYAAAIPLRMAIVIVLLSLSAIIARRWLDTRSIAARTTAVDSPSLLAVVRYRYGVLKMRAMSGVDRSHYRAMILRLVWQSWRESWKFLAVPVVLAAVCLAIGLGGGRLYSVVSQHNVLFPILAACLFCCLAASPPLLGALAFSADQRRGGVRFLAEHAAAPRVVWLSRHLVWLGMLIALVVLVVVAAATLLTSVVQTHLQDYQRSHDEFEALTYAYGARELRSAIASGLYAGTTAMTFLWSGALAAYAIGQFCSMLLRSEILSAFTSLVLAVLLIPWIAALVAWRLSGCLFLLPLAIAFLLATWLRAPHWIAGRNSWRTWALPAAAILGTLAVFGVMLPQIRLSEVRSIPLHTLSTGKPTPASMAFLKKRQKEAIATAEMYLKAASLLTASIADDPLDPWLKPEFISAGGVAPSGGIDATKIPADQLPKFLVAKQKSLELESKQREAALKLAIEASQRPTCQFEFPLTPGKGSIRYSSSISVRLTPNQTYEAVSELLHELISTPTAEPALDRLLAALRMNRHMAMNQPTAIVVRQLQSERQILAEIAKAMAATERTKDRTNAERRAALDRLQKFFREDDLLSQALFADREVLRDVMTGKEPPLILSLEPVGLESHLAFAANELPWERERALIALDVITDQNLQNALGLMNSLHRSAGEGWGPNELRQWYRPTYRPALWLTQQPAAATSYLVSMEYQLRVPVNELCLEYCHTVTVERATLLQIALAMYRADHKEYPPTLEALVPKYLEKLPLDPYSMGGFEYRAKGLEKPLGGYGFVVGDNIPAHTPMLWSIGPDNFQLQERLVATGIFDDDAGAGVGMTMTEDHPANAQKRGAETMYTLERSDWNQLYSNDNPREFLFTLPK